MSNVPRKYLPYNVAAAVGTAFLAGLNSGNVFLVVLNSSISLFNLYLSLKVILNLSPTKAIDTDLTNGY